MRSILRNGNSRKTSLTGFKIDRTHTSFGNIPSDTSQRRGESQKPALPYIDTKNFIKKSSKSQIRKVVRKRSISLLRGGSSKGSIKSSYRE
jgi:hypothetical protein